MFERKDRSVSRATTIEAKYVAEEYRWAVRFRYDPDLVAELKDIVDWRYRSWNPEFKVWWIDTLAFDDLVRGFEDLGVSVSIDDSEMTIPSPSSESFRAGP